MPKDIHFAHLFQVFNTVSFSLVLGLPMLLFFKHLGASATVLGIVAALPPLLNILQIPAASLVEKFGFRNFVLKGWTVRSFFILGMTAVPVLALFLDPGTCVALMLFLLFAYNTSRGASACGFLPWMTHLVPDAVRGTFLSRDQACGAVASLATLLGTAALFRETDSVLAFGGAFAVSFGAAMVSLYFLRRVPDVPVPKESQGNGAGGRVPWKEMLLYPPFLKLLVYNVAVNAALAAAGVFWIPALRDLFGWKDATITGFAAWGTAVSIGALWGFGRIVDRVGSRPLLVFSGTALIIHFSLWFAVVSRLLPMSVPVFLVLQFFSGLGGSVFNMANTRLVMGTVPAMGRSHFFALFSVVNSLVLGLLPVIWGIALDGLKGWHWTSGRADFNRYSLLYLSLVAVVGVSLLLLKRLQEPRAMTTEAFFYELLVASPSRAMTRLVGPRRTLP